MFCLQTLTTVYNYLFSIKSVKEIDLESNAVTGHHKCRKLIESFETKNPSQLVFTNRNGFILQSRMRECSGYKNKAKKKNMALFKLDRSEKKIRYNELELSCFSRIFHCSCRRFSVCNCILNSIKIRSSYKTLVFYCFESVFLQSKFSFLQF